MRDFGAPEDIGTLTVKPIDTLEEASAALDRFGHSDDPLVEFAREEIFSCTCGLSTLDRVRTAVRMALCGG